MLICFYFYSWLYKEATVQEVEVMPEDGTARVKVIIGNSAFGRYKNLFPNSKIFMPWNCILFEEKKLISLRRCEMNLRTCGLKSVFLPQLMFLMHFRKGHCFRQLLYGNNKSFELHSLGKCKDSTEFFMLKELLVTSCGPETHHGSASESWESIWMNL